MERVAIPDRPTTNLEVLTVTADRNRVWRIGLYFYGISSGFLARLNEANRLVEVLIVIGGKLGDHVYRLIRSDFAVANCEPGHRRHVVLPTEQKVPKSTSFSSR